MKKIFSNISAHKRLAGIEVLFLADGSTLLNAVLLKKEKNKIITEQELLEADGYEAIARFTGKQIPVVLVIKGKGVINKSLISTKGETETQTIFRALPGINPDEICSQIRTSQGKTDIHLIRKTSLSDVIDKLNEQGVKNFITCYLNSDTVTNLSENISSCFGSPEKGVGDHPVLTEQVNEHSEKYQLRVKTLATLTGSLFILMINYFVFEHYHSKLQDLNSDLEKNGVLMQLNEQLKSEYVMRRDFMEKNGFSDGSQTSFYADRLAYLLPQDIRWTRLEVYPIHKKKSDDLSYEFKKDEITITGNCKQSASLNEWLKKIKGLTWVENVELSSYSQKSAKDEGNFEIHLKLK